MQGTPRTECTVSRTTTSETMHGSPGVMYMQGGCWGGAWSTTLPLRVEFGIVS